MNNQDNINSQPPANSPSPFPPKNIKILGLTYQYKQKLAHSKFSYRCKDRANCTGLVHLTEEALNNYNDSPLALITLHATKNEHSLRCKFNIIDIDKDIDPPINSPNNGQEGATNNGPNQHNIGDNNTSPNPGNSFTNTQTTVNNNVNHASNNSQSIENIKRLLYLHIWNPISFHINLLNENGIILSRHQVKYQLETLRNHQFMSNEQYNKNPFRFTDRLTENLNDPNIPFCLAHTKFFDINSKATETISIYSTSFQLNILSKSKQWFLDGTFRVAPAGYYQVLIIHAKDYISNSIIPVAFILLTSKKSEIYFRAFNELLTLIKISGSTPVVEQIHSDFEKNIVSEFKKIFGASIHFKGCWFHYMQCLVRKLRNMGLYKLRYASINKKILSVLKYLPHVKRDQRNIFMSSFRLLFTENFLKTTIDNVDLIRYSKFFIYYHKNWITWDSNSQEVLGIEIDNQNTNNPSETFNRRLNERVSIKQPRISYLAHCLFKISQDEYKKYCGFVNSPHKRTRTADNFANDFLLFSQLIQAFIDDLNIEELFASSFFSAASNRDRVPETEEELINIVFGE